MNGKIEEIILRHGQRGMQILRDYLSPAWAEDAARAILGWKKGTVLLTTGFYVAGYAETDGPAGTMTLAKALEQLGYHPVIVTDRFCEHFFELKNLETVYVPMDAGTEDYRRILERFRPVGMISIERCGLNTEGDYANMRGISIRENTARIDTLFDLAPDYSIETIGVGDGGNEIGMGNVAEIIAGKLSLVPCRTKTSYLVIASVSNWGAYGVTAYLSQLSGKDVFLSFSEIEQFIRDTVAIGSVDGITHERISHVDGFDEAVEQEILDALHAAIRPEEP